MTDTSRTKVAMPESKAEGEASGRRVILWKGKVMTR
jgi:hypothetical protein